MVKNTNLIKKQDAFQNMDRYERLLCFVLIAALLALITRIAYVNMTSMMANMHPDLANEIKYRQLIWETKSLLPANWYNAQELHINRLLFLYVPIYAITKQFILSYQISIILGMLLQLAALAYLLKQINFSVPALLFTLCCYLGINAQSGFLFVIMDSYAGFAIAIFITLGIRFNLEREWVSVKSMMCKASLMKLTLLACIAFYFGFSSPRLILILYAPLLGAETVIYIKNYGLKEYITYNKDLFFIGLIAFLLVLSGAGHMIMLKSGAHIVPTPLSIKSLSQQLEWSNITLQLQGLLMAFHLYSDEINSLLSTKGIMYILSILVIFFLLFTAVYAVRSNHKQYKTIGWFFLITTLVVFGYSIVVALYDSSYRYYLATSLLGVVLLGGGINRAIQHKAWWVWWAVCGMLITAGLFCTFPHRTDSGYNHDLQEAADFIENEGYRIVTGSLQVVDNLSAYTNGRIVTRHWGSNFFEPFPYLTDISLYTWVYQEEPNILMITDEDVTNMQDDEVLSEILDEGEKLAKFGPYNLYRYDRNLMCIITFPTKAGERSEFNFEQWPHTMRVNAQYNKSDKSITIGSEGGFFYGPYIIVDKGIYDISLFYNVQEAQDDSIGTLSVTCENGQMSLATDLIDSNANIVTLYDVNFDETKKNVEIVGTCNEGNIVAFKKIIITRKS